MSIQTTPNLNKVARELTRIARRKRFWKDEDLQQIYWIGVLSKVDKVDWETNPLFYLNIAGSNAVRHYQRSTHAKNLLRYCDTCNKFYAYSTIWCRECNSEMRVVGRFSAYTETPSYDEDILERISIEQFVATLEGNYKHVAERWLLDRVDLLYDNHSKQLALELGVSAPRISKIKKWVKEEYRLWEGITWA